MKNIKETFFCKLTFIVYFFYIGSFITSCQQKIKNTNSVKTTKVQKITTPKPMVDPNGVTIKTRFNTPEGFQRVSSDVNSFGFHLQNLPLKSHGSLVMHFDGTYKPNYSTYIGVVDLPIGKSNLHQCADAVIRLRTDYLFSQKKYNEIEFLFVNGKRANYSTYLNGRTPSKQNLWSYLEYVFSYANTYSLNKQLYKKDIKNLEIGDVFIRGGFPGHTIIVVDKCVNKNSGAVKFMLAQSYMPAQETQVLANPNDPQSPWYDLTNDYDIITSEYNFTKDEFKSFVK